MKKLLIILFVLCFCVSTFGQFIPIKMFGQQPSGPFAEGLVFYFRGIEAGEAVDESFNRNHGTILGTTWMGGGLDFTLDSSDVVQLDRTIPFDNGFTFIVSGLLRSTGSANAGRFIDWQTGSSQVEFQTAGAIRFVRDHVTTNGIWQSGGHSFDLDIVFAIVSNGTDVPKLFENGVEQTFSEIVAPEDALVAQARAEGKVEALQSQQVETAVESPLDVAKKAYIEENGDLEGFTMSVDLYEKQELFKEHKATQAVETETTQKLQVVQLASVDAAKIVHDDWQDVINAGVKLLTKGEHLDLEGTGNDFGELTYEKCKTAIERNKSVSKETNAAPNSELSKSEAAEKAKAKAEAEKVGTQQELLDNYDPMVVGKSKL